MAILFFGELDPSATINFFLLKSKRFVIEIIDPLQT
jgi:hypothetical protein